MKILALCVLLTACDGEQDLPVTAPDIIGEATGVGSFRLRNGEVREEMLAEFDKEGIEYWFNDDGSIGHHLADSEAIDRIGNLIISEYITRN